MSRSRAFNRFHRWTAKVRRQHRKAWLPLGQDEATPTPVDSHDKRRVSAERQVLREARRDMDDALMLETALTPGVEA